MISRRHLIRNAGVLGAGAIAYTNIANAQTPVTESDETATGIAKIGDMRDAFDAEFGAGRDEGGFVVYGEDSEGTAHYYVLFNDQGIAQTIEIDFSPLPNEGLPAEEEIGQSRFVPDEAVSTMFATVGSYRGDENHYGVNTWHSANLASAIGIPGYVVVMDRLTYAGPDLGVLIQNTMVSLQIEEVNTLSPSDSFMGAHTPLAEWEAYSGETMGSFGLTFEDEQGSWVVSESALSLEPAAPLGVSEANELLGTMTPPGDIMWTTFIPPSPLGESGIRLHGIEFQGGEMITAQWITDGEETGTVSKIMQGVELVS